MSIFLSLNVSGKFSTSQFRKTKKFEDVDRLVWKGIECYEGLF